MGKQTMTLKGLSGYDLKGLVGPKGALRAAFPTNLPSDFVTYLSTYFSLIRNTFKPEWDDPKKYILATNRGLHPTSLGATTAETTVAPKTKGQPMNG
jgi:hypothetical protein